MRTLCSIVILGDIRGPRLDVLGGIPGDMVLGGEGKGERGEVSVYLMH